MKGIALNLSEKLATFAAHGSPRTVAEMNDYASRLVKLQGDFVWHTHADTDETFIVLHGTMDVAFRDHTVTLGQGELCVIPRGVEHLTRASDECHALIIEPRSVVNTGDTVSHLTADNDTWV